jgi:phytoene dehydrogenase-like protein
VASSINLEQTFLEMMERDRLPADVLAGVEASPHMDWSFFSVHLALADRPRYRAAEFDASIDDAWVVNVGYDTREAIDRHWQDVRAGLLPDPRPNCAVNSLFDPTDAPDGCYTGLIRHFAPFELADGGAQAWDRVARDYGRRCIDKWREMAPNLDDGAVLEWNTYTPLDIARRMPNMVRGDWMGGLIDLGNLLDLRPSPQLSGYRAPARGLYLCGATQHPHGFVTFAPAYNALQVIAEDLDLERWWR